jgi:hypothetical protein
MSSLRMRDSSDIRECLIKSDMRRQIGGKKESAFNHMTRKIRDYQISGRQLRGGDAARLDDDQLFRSINAARVAPNVSTTRRLRTREKFAL